MAHRPLAKLTIFTPRTIGPLGPTMVTHRAFDRVDEFATAVGATGSIAVTVVEGQLDDPPDEGFIAIYSDPNTHHVLSHHPALCPRVVLLRECREDVRRMINAFGVAAVVEDDRYWRWYTKQSLETEEGLYGRKDVAERMGAAVKRGFYSTEHHGLLIHPQCKALPTLLAAYLCALASMNT